MTSLYLSQAQHHMILDELAVYPMQNLHVEAIYVDVLESYHGARKSMYVSCYDLL